MFVSLLDSDGNEVSYEGYARAKIIDNKATFNEVLSGDFIVTHFGVHIEDKMIERSEVFVPRRLTVGVTPILSNIK